MEFKTVKTFLISLGISMIIGYLFVPKIFIDAEQSEADLRFERSAEFIETDYEGIKIKKIERKEPTYNIDIEIPSFTNEKLNIVIKEHVKHIKEEFFISIKGQVTEERQGYLTVRTDIYLSGPDLYSIVLSEEFYTGGANANQKAKVWLVDLKEEKFVPQDIIFNDLEEAKDQVRSLVKEELINSSQYEGYILEEELERWVTKDDYRFENMYITDGYLVFKFNKYEVAAGATGMPEVKVPISEVKDLIKPEWYERISE